MFFVQAKKLRFSFDEKQRSWKMDTGNFLSLEDPGIGSGLWYFLLFEAFPIPKHFIEAAHSPKPRLFVGTALGKSKRATCIYCQGPGDDCQQNISVNCHPTSESMGKAGVEEFELDVHGARSKPRQASMSKRAAGAYQWVIPLDRIFSIFCNIVNIGTLPAHWNDISSMDMDLSLFRPVYSPKASHRVCEKNNNIILKFRLGIILTPGFPWGARSAPFTQPGGSGGWFFCSGGWFISSMLGNQWLLCLILFFKTVPELTLPALETCDCWHIWSLIRVTGWRNDQHKDNISILVKQKKNYKSLWKYNRYFFLERPIRLLRVSTSLYYISLSLGFGKYSTGWGLGSGDPL